jgi:DNA polymerase-1
MNVTILDAYNLMHRARSGFTRGQYPVIYNFFRGLRPIIQELQPDIVYFVLEGQPKKNQHLLENYKGSRAVDPDVDPKKYAALQEFHRQKREIIKLIRESLPFVTVRHPDYEADDVMAELARMRATDDVTIVSGDSDMIQMLQESSSVRLYHPIKKEFLEAPAYDYVQWKALRGDPTDDIPGIPGVGDKTATKLILDEAKRAQFFVKKAGAQEIWERNQELIRLTPFSEHDRALIEFKHAAADWDAVRTAFQAFGFGSMLKGSTWEKYVATFDCLRN